MRLFIFIWVSFIGQSNTNLTTLRISYFAAAKTETEMPAFKKAIDACVKKDTYYYCYLAAYNSLLSNYEKTLSKKLKFFESYKTTLEKSFALAENIDNRFLRFCVQSKTPKLLNYKHNITSDKTYILNNICKDRDGNYKKNIILFLEKSNLLSEKEKTSLKKL